MVGILAGFSFSQVPEKGPPPPPAPKRITGDSNYPLAKASDLPGEIVGNVYQNKYFRLRIVPPEAWLAQSPAVNEAIKAKGTELVSGKTKAADKALDESVQRTTILYTVTKDILGIQNNGSLSVVVERIPPLVQIRNGHDFLRLTLQNQKVLTLPADMRFSESILSENFGTETLYYLDIERSVYSQRLYVIARNGYAISFLITYFTKEDLETMKEILRQSDFAWKE